MILNKWELGLPDWPYISEVGPQDYVVEGKHISFGRYRFLRRLLKLASIVFFVYLGKVLLQSATYWQYGALRWMGYFMAFVFIVAMFPVPRWFCWLFFRSVTRVRFSPTEIIVNRRTYNLAPQLDIQFRANRAPLSERDCAGESAREANFLLKFRVVDMVYGLSVVPIATVAYDFRAEQFAVALQYAYERSQSRAPAAHGHAVAGDGLPE